MNPDQLLRFGSFQLDLHNEQLRRGSHVIPLRPKPFAVLHYLVEHAGQLATRDAIVAAVWARTRVNERVLNDYIQALRVALDDDPVAPRFIETVRGRGYRFIAPIAAGAAQEGARGWGRGTGPVASQAPSVVGREAELAQLHAWLAKALNGERQVVFVTGEPGIGKTAVVEAFLRSLGSSVQRLALEQVQGPKSKVQGQEENQKAKIEAGDWGLGAGLFPPQAPSIWTPDAGLRTSDLPMPNARSLMPSPWIARGQCVEQYGAGEAYLPWLAALGQLCRDTHDPLLLTQMRQYAPSWLAQLPWLVSAEGAEQRQHRLSGVTRERMLRELAELLDVLTAEQLLIVVLEDLHWSDTATVELISFLARRRTPAKLLVIGTYRPADVRRSQHPLWDHTQELQVHGHCEELALELLSEPAVTTYLAVRFSQAPFVSDFAPLMYRRTEGNPLFLVATVDFAIQQQWVRQVNGQWRLQRDRTAVLRTAPGNLRALIERHFDRLELADQDMLLASSLAGVEFCTAAVAAALDTEAESIEAQCDRLARTGQFVAARGSQTWPDGTFSARYGFRHALYQTVLSERVTTARRITWHQKLARRMERGYGERCNEIAAELAVHYEQGRDYAQAVHYHHEAAETALRRGAYAAATTQVRQALPLLQTLSDTPARTQKELTLYVTLGAASVATTGYASPETEQTCAHARALCQRVGETPQLFPVLWGLWVVYFVRGDLATVHDLSAQLLRVARTAQDSGLLVEAHLAAGLTSVCSGDLAAARTHLEAGIAQYDPDQHAAHAFVYGQDPGVVCLSWAAWALWLGGYPEQATQKTRDALKLARTVSHPFSLAYALVCAAVLHQMRRDSLAVREHAEELVALATAHGFALWCAGGTVLRGWAAAMQGHAREGMAELGEGLAAWQQTGAELLRPYGLALLAEACAVAKQADLGLVTADMALSLIDASGERWWAAELQRLRGECFGQVDALHDAETWVQQAVAAARAQGAKSLELRAVMSLCRLWRRRGKTGDARQLLAETYGWFTEGWDTADLQEARALLESWQ